jgi:hypothetical protein
LWPRDDQSFFASPLWSREYDLNCFILNCKRSTCSGMLRGRRSLTAVLNTDYFMRATLAKSKILVNSPKEGEVFLTRRRSERRAANGANHHYRTTVTAFEFFV